MDPGPGITTRSGYRVTVDAADPTAISRSACISGFELPVSEARINLEWMLRRGLAPTEWALVKARFLEDQPPVVQSKVSGVPLHLLDTVAERLKYRLIQTLREKAGYSASTFQMPESRAA